MRSGLRFESSKRGNFGLRPIPRYATVWSIGKESDGMKRLGRVLALLLLVSVLAGCAGKPTEKFTQSTVPFSVEDVTAILQGKSTVADYVNAVHPTGFSWDYLGELTKQTQLTMQCNGGTMTICFVAENGTVDGKAKGQDTELPEEIMGLSATVEAIEWLSKDFTGIPMVRGIAIGDSKEKVLASFLLKGTDEKQLYTIEDLNAQANRDWIADWAFVGGRFVEKGDFYTYDALEYGWCELKGKEEWKLYYNILYDLVENKVHSVRLYIEGDERDKTP